MLRKIIIFLVFIFTIIINFPNNTEHKGKIGISKLDKVEFSHVEPDPIPDYPELTLNQRQLITLSNSSSITYKYTINDDRIYIINTTPAYYDVDTYLTVRNTTNGTLTSNDCSNSCFSRVELKNQGRRDILITISFLNNVGTKSCYLEIRNPRATFCAIDYSLYESGDINTISDIEYPEYYCEDIYDCYEILNPQSDYDLITSYQGLTKPIDSEIFFFSGHGGICAASLGNGAYFQYNNAICTNNNRLTVWACCNSATENENGKSLASLSVDRGSESSLGFDDTTTTWASNIFTDTLFYSLNLGCDLSYSASLASSMILWPYSGVHDYVIYGNPSLTLFSNENNRSSYCNENELNLSNYNLSSQTLNLFEFLNKSDYFERFNFVNCIRFYLKINGFCSNFYIDFKVNDDLIVCSKNKEEILDAIEETKNLHFDLGNYKKEDVIFFKLDNKWIPFDISICFEDNIQLCENLISHEKIEYVVLDKLWGRNK